MDHEASGEAAAAAGDSRHLPDEEPPSRGVTIGIGPARPADLAALVALEGDAFAGDRLSARSFRRFLAGTNAILLVARANGAPAGYALVLMRRDSRRARLYSIAVAAAWRGRGVGRALVAAAERAAARRGATALRLEVRADNAPAIALYAARGYAQFGRIPAYYHDGAGALRFERVLRPAASPAPAKGKTRP